MTITDLLEVSPDPAPLFAAEPEGFVPAAEALARTLNRLAAGLGEYRAGPDRRRAEEAARELDILAAALIWEFNRVQSGRGTFTELVSLRAIDDPSFPIAQGTLHVLVGDADHEVEVDFDRRAVVVRMGALSPSLEASLRADGRVRIRTTSPELRFGFLDDSSGFLAAVGLNPFFSGSRAADMAVVPGLHPADPGRFAVLRDLREVDGKQTFEEYLRVVSGRRRAEAVEVRSAFERESLLARQRAARERLDVDAAFMIRLQRSIQAADRVSAAVEELVSKGNG